VAHSIGIDLGTTNVKVVLVSVDGAIIGSATRPVPTEVSDDGRVVEQDPEAIWEATIHGMSEVAALSPEAAARVISVGVCSQYSSIVGVDAFGLPTTPMVMWSDRRGTDHSRQIMVDHPQAFAIWSDRHGIPPVGGGLSLAHILHLQIDHPQSHAATVAYLEPMDYLTARLSGTITATQPSSFMIQLCDNRTLGATDHDPDLVAMSGVDPTRLPALVDVEEPVGIITRDTTERVGLPAGVVVAPGTNDTAAVAIATGSLDHGVAGLAMGTTSVLVDTVASFTCDLDHGLTSMPGPFNDTHLVMAENGLGGRVLQQVLDSVIHPTDPLGPSTTRDPWASIPVSLGASPQGANGVMFLPWLDGSMAPSTSPAMRGGFVNMSLRTNRTDMTRAVIEGLAHNLNWLLPHVEQMTTTPVEVVRFTGGGARLEGWPQVLADILDKPVAITNQPHLATARAAALLALTREGTIHRSELSRLVDIGRSHDPSPEHRALYDHRQSQFEACFEALLPIHTALGGTP